MRLKWRLTLFFVAIVAVPLIAAGLVLQNIVGSEIERRTSFALNPSLHSAQRLFEREAGVLDERIQAAVAGSGIAEALRRGDEAVLNRMLERVVRESDGIDFVGVLDSKDRLAGYAEIAPTFTQGFSEPPVTQRIGQGGGLEPGLVRTEAVELTDGRNVIGRVSGGFWLDNGFLDSLALEGVGLSLAFEGQIIASTTPLIGTTSVGDISFDKEFGIDLGEESRARAISLPGGMALVASLPSGPIEEAASGVGGWMLTILLIVVAVTGFLAFWLARLLTSPLEEAAEGARAIERGEWGHLIAVRSRDEIGRLATAFNEMSTRLEATVSALSSSRDQMRRAVRSVGDALRSTHDMKQILSSVISIAGDAVLADSGVLWMLSPSSDELYPARSTGLDSTDLGAVKLGRGIAGLAADRATTLVLPDDSGPRPAAGEPALPVTIAVPIFSKDRMRGVVSVYRKDADKPFSKDDVETVQFLAQQSGVAVENVLLHEEAQRLSITDGLTGIWNRRYFSIQFRQVLATSKRFNRQFSLLMIDLDHFKQVNDNHGHQRGDAVLVELTQRAQRALREVDTIARYGGEEFVILLTETDVGGAETTARKILDAVRSEPFTVAGDHALNITASIGVASFPRHGTTLTRLVDSADRALYKAKNDGRDRVVVAEDDKPPSLRLAQ